MKKKTVKKLELSKETVRNLEQEKLWFVAGAYDYLSGPTNCAQMKQRPSCEGC